MAVQPRVEPKLAAQKPREVALLMLKVTDQRGDGAVGLSGAQGVVVCQGSAGKAVALGTGQGNLAIKPVFVRILVVDKVRLVARNLQVKRQLEVERSKRSKERQKAKDELEGILVNEPEAKDWGSTDIPMSIANVVCIRPYCTD